MQILTQSVMLYKRPHSLDEFNSVDALKWEKNTMFSTLWAKKITTSRQNNRQRMLGLSPLWPDSCEFVSPLLQRFITIIETRNGFFDYTGWKIHH